MQPATNLICSITRGYKPKYLGLPSNLSKLSNLGLREHRVETIGSIDYPAELTNRREQLAESSVTSAVGGYIELQRGSRVSFQK